MTTTIIGLGNMGRGLARRLAGQTDLLVVGRNEAEAADFAASLPGVRATSLEDGIAEAEIVVLAVGYDAAMELAARPDLAGKTVVDMSNPVTPDYSGLRLGHDTSAAEEIQKVASSAKVVKAFNTIFAGLFDAPQQVTADVPVFVASNDEVAAEKVADLIRKAGFTVENVGSLDAARLIEPLGMLNIRIGYGLARGTAIAPKWINVAA